MKTEGSTAKDSNGIRERYPAEDLHQKQNILNGVKKDIYICIILLQTFVKQQTDIKENVTRTFDKITLQCMHLPQIALGPQIIITVCKTPC
jgi:hypothetical protein